MHFCQTLWRLSRIATTTQNEHTLQDHRTATIKSSFTISNQHLFYHEHERSFLEMLWPISGITPYQNGGAPTPICIDAEIKEALNHGYVSLCLDLIDLARHFVFKAPTIELKTNALQKVQRQNRQAHRIQPLETTPPKTN